jgi:Putative methyltransferase
MKLRSGRWLRRLRSREWSGWPEEAYQRERYQQRLSAVHEHLTECLNLAPQGGVRSISVCSGDGRDVLGVLEFHRRAADVAAFLVELDSHSVAAGESRVKRAGLESIVSFLNTDATIYDTYQGIAPADIILVCGVWGHVPPEERAELVTALECFCKPGGRVIWTRGVSKGTHRLEAIEAHFSGANWRKTRVSITPNEEWGVVTHQYCGLPKEIPATGRIFHFTRKVGRGFPPPARRGL